MKAIRTKLDTGITTIQNKKENGVVSIEVINDNYDDRFDFPTAGSVMVNDFYTYLGSIFKPNN